MLSGESALRSDKSLIGGRPKFRLIWCYSVVLNRHLVDFINGRLNPSPRLILVYDRCNTYICIIIISVIITALGRNHVSPLILSR